MSYFKEFLNKFNNKEVNIYIDMDGVVADYDALGFLKIKGTEDVYLNKRPIMTIINLLKEVNELPNIKLNILSCTTRNNQVEGKYIWLSKYMDFIKKENINIISREDNDFLKAAMIKKNFLEQNIDKFKVNIVIDDSHDVINEIIKLDLDIIPLHITSIMD